MAYQAELETIWRKLRPHVEWARGFNLIYLFARHPAPVEFLRSRLADSLIVNSLSLRAIPFRSPEAVEETLNAVLSTRPLAGQRPPLWLEMWRDSGDAGWQTARRQVLARLNERRFLLERDVDCPMLLVLPANLRGTIASLAPDLWTVRVFTADLPMPEVVIAPPEPGPASSAQVMVENETPEAAEREWRRLWDNTPDKQRIDIWAGVAAVEAALARKDIPAAQRMATEVMQAVHDRADSDTAAKRYLLVALSLQGDVSMACGKLEEARAAYRESLGLSRNLREMMGDGVQTLRDLGGLLIKVGETEEALGRHKEARAAYLESLGLFQLLDERAEASISLNKLGGVAAALGHTEEARAAYQRSLQFFRDVRNLPQELNILKRLADVEKRAGDTEAAARLETAAAELETRVVR